MSRLPILLAVTLPLLGACNAPEQMPGDTPEAENELVDRSPADSNEAGDADADGIDEADGTISEIPATDGPGMVPEDVFGRWASSSSECTAAAGPPVTISSSRYQGIDASCEINELVDNGDGFTASMSCESDGASEAQLLKLTPDGDTLTLNWVARDLPELSLVRCED